MGEPEIKLEFSLSSHGYKLPLVPLAKTRGIVMANEKKMVNDGDDDNKRTG